jgi:integrase
MTTPKGNSIYDLAFARLAESTKERYTRVLGKFATYCRRYHLDTTDMTKLDFAAACWARDLYSASRDHKGKDSAVKLDAALATFLPESKGQLRWLGLVAKGWARLVPRVSFAPMTIEMAALTAITLAKTGNEAMGVAVLISFGALLRSGEVGKIRVRDVTFGADNKLPSVGGSHYASIRLFNTKTRADDSAKIYVPEFAAVLRAYIAKNKLKPSDKLFAFTAPRYRKLFGRIVKLLGFVSARAPLVPHSLRHGGATWLYERGMPLDDVMIAGRWTAAPSTRTYIKAGRTLTLDTTLSWTTAYAAIYCHRNVITMWQAALGKDCFTAVEVQEAQTRALVGSALGTAAPALPVARRLFN